MIRNSTKKLLNNLGQKVVKPIIQSSAEDIVNTINSRSSEENFVNRMLLANILIEQKIKNKTGPQKLKDVEFKVFSQFGQDGILQYLINNVEIKNPIFIEFGVQTYLESTTKFLLVNNHWSGLAMDGNDEYMKSVNATNEYWPYDLKAKGAFITTENINQLISEYTKEQDIGLLVVDIDGNDYWVWQAIEVVKPRIVVCEYNNIFGPEKSVTIPYKADFVLGNGMYYGASLKSLVQLASKKGYVFVGCNSAGNDAFFVKKDLLKAPLKEISIEEGFVYSNFRGTQKAIKEKRLQEIQDWELWDVEQNKARTIKDIYQL